MFGLSQREQRLSAQERGFKMLLDHALAVKRNNAELELAKLKNEKLMLQKEILALKGK